MKRSSNPNGNQQPTLRYLVNKTVPRSAISWVLSIFTGQSHSQLTPYSIEGKTHAFRNSGQGCMNTVWTCCFLHASTFARF